MGARLIKPGRGTRTVYATLILMFALAKGAYPLAMLAFGFIVWDSALGAEGPLTRRQLREFLPAALLFAAAAGAAHWLAAVRGSDFFFFFRAAMAACLAAGLLLPIRSSWAAAAGIGACMWYEVDRLTGVPQVPKPDQAAAGFLLFYIITSSAATGLALGAALRWGGRRLARGASGPRPGL